ncbi:MAG: ParB/RepB/Spo0J family partition protein, partial [Rhodospirillales bacterium]|nr:ParB/RepB/Spo0J family partition protein [Rhodospirillales bacterium]
MSGETKRSRSLGRGLSALLGEDADAGAAAPGARSLPIESLRPGRFQPRRRMTENDLRDLAQSIAAKGVLQPILVRAAADEAGRFEIIAGERRWRAAQLAQLHEVPVVVKALSDREAMEIALIENLQREDLSPLDEAEGYRRLINEFGHTQEALAESIGKSRSHVANTLRLLALPDGVKAMLDANLLTAGHARALLAAADPEVLARTVARRALNVRQTERLVAQSRGDGPAARSQRRRSAPGALAAKTADIAALERDLSGRLGLTVEIRHRAGAGSVVLHYRSLEQLDDILKRLS